MDLFTGKTLLITGGTGSFGATVLNRLIHTDIGQIRIFSRDEKKQDDLRREYLHKAPELAHKIRFCIGDVRDLRSVEQAMRGVDHVFHAASLKQVPSCEFYPLEAAKTNIFGTANILQAAVDAKVETVVCLSTDKAVYPVNAMGLSKAMMEKLALAQIRTEHTTRICCTRYGNVLCSRGSVIPQWIRQIENDEPLVLTEPSMTRFLMSLDEAVDLVVFAFIHGRSGDIFVPKAPACSIEILAQAVGELFDGKRGSVCIGARHGEKLHETLMTEEECGRAIDMGRFYRIPCDVRDMNYESGAGQARAGRGERTVFDSASARQLTVQEVKDLLLRQSYVRNALERRCK